MSPAPAVICLRPEADFHEVGITPPSDLSVIYREVDQVTDDELASARAIVLASVGAPLPSHWAAGATALELVQFTGAGVDRAGALDQFPAGTLVANVPAANAREVAEYVLFAAGSLLRALPFADREVRAGRYAQGRARLTPAAVRSLHSRTVGVVGLGNIGLEVARLMAAVGARVLYADAQTRHTQAAEALGLIRVELDELLATCDLVTLHVPLVPATHGLIDAARLRLMPRGALLINAARGGVVDESALARALSDGHLGGAAIDVYAQEPPGPDSPLLGLRGAAMDRVLLTPHIAGVAYEAARGLYTEAWANVHRALVEAAPVRHQVWPTPVDLGAQS